MKLTRRDALKWGLLSGTAALPGCGEVVRRLAPPRRPERLHPPAAGARPLARALSRVSFGIWPGELERVARMGWEAFVEEQLAPDDRQEDRIAIVRLAQVEVTEFRSGDLFNFAEEEVLRQLGQSVLLRAVYSRWQVREALVDFWSNHFNIYARKRPCAYLKVADDRDALRPHVLGRFRDLLGASAHSAAMLMYLDNQENRAGVPNENYARELMELHTLGVDGGYTQRDVQEVARCLTGWTVDRRWRLGQVVFDPAAHDEGEKVVLGMRILAGQGRDDLGRVLDLLAHHPATARYLSARLCRRFLGQAPAGLVGRMAQVYERTGGDLRALAGALLRAPEFMEAGPVFRRPLDFAVAALRSLAADTDGGDGLQKRLTDMGQPIFQHPMPDGYPEEPEAWTGSLLARWQFALDLTAHRIPGVRVDLAGLAGAGGREDPAGQVDTFLELLYHRPADHPSLVSLRATLQRFHRRAGERGLAPTVALALAAPEFQWTA